MYFILSNRGPVVGQTLPRLVCWQHVEAELE